MDYQGWAVRIRDAYAGPAIDPIRHAEPGAGMSDAYAIQARNTEYWLSAGRKIVGAKIGLTSKAVQAQLNVDQPDFGILFADMRVPDTGSVEVGRLLQPRVEAEIAFCLGRDLAETGDDMAEVVEAIAYALPAIEIVDSRITGWDIKIFDTIADNASSGLFVLGTEPVDISRLDLAACAMRLEKNGDTVSQGNGAACLGNPLNAVAWLANAKARYNGSPLKAGDIILAGALGPMIGAAPGDHFRAEIDGLGGVGISFAR